MPPAIDITAGTSGLLESLRTLRRKVKLLTVLYGVGIVLACAVALLLAVVLLDFLLRLPTEARVVVNLVAAGALGFALWRWVAAPALRRLTLHDLAGTIEATFPQFDDTLRSTVAFASRDVPGSAVMKTRTVERATELARSVDLNRAVAARPTWVSLGVGGGAVAALVVAASLVNLVYPNFTETAASRLFAGSAEWPHRNALEITPPKAKVAAGTDVSIKFRDTKGNATTATVRFRYDGGAWQTAQVTRAADGTFEAKIQALIGATRDTSRLDVRVQAGDAEQTIAPVEIVPPLEVRSAVAVVRAPAYAGEGETQFDLTAGPARAPLGATVSVRLETNKRLAGAPVLVSADGRPMPPYATDPAAPNGVAVVTFPIDRTIAAGTFQFEVRVRDVDGLENPAASYALQVKDDEAPVNLRIRQPLSGQERTPDAVVPVTLSAEDDYGFRSVSLLVQVSDAQRNSRLPADQKIVVPLLQNGKPAPGVTARVGPNSTASRKEFLWDFQWDLETLTQVKLNHGDMLVLTAVAEDNFELAGKLTADGQVERHAPITTTGACFITIIDHAHFAAIIDAQLNQARTEIQTAQRMEEVARQMTEDEAKRAAETGKLDPNHERMAAQLTRQQREATAQAAKATERLSALVQRMAENKTREKDAQAAAQRATEMLKNTQVNPMRQADKQLVQAAQTKAKPADPKASPEQQKAQKEQNDKEAAKQASEAMRQAAADQRQASNELDQAAKQLAAFGDVTPQLKELEDLRDRQAKLAEQYKQELKQEVGKRPEEISQEKKDKLDKLTEEQDKLAGKANDLIEAMKGKGKRMEQTDPASSEALKQTARIGEQQNVAGKMSKTPKQDSKPQSGQPQDPQAQKPGDQKPGDQKPGDQKPGDQKPGDQANSGQKPQTKPSDQANSGQQNPQTKPSDQANAKPQDSKPQDSKPQDSKPQDPQQANAQQQKSQQQQQQDGASQQMQQNQQAQAQQQHKEIELGLEMMAEELRKAERAKLAQLQKELQQLQAKVDELVQRQAGHNVDNLRLQANGDPAAGELKLAAELPVQADRDGLLALAQRPAKLADHSRTDLETLFAGQTKTFDLTAAAIEMAKKLQDPAPASKLNAAQMKMEQAGLYLRQRNLPEAYKPSQVDALAALREAKKLVDDAKREADKKDQELQEATIKQAYVKLLKEQNEKVAAALDDINKTGRDEEGNLKRAALTKLRALPEEQQKIADQAVELGKRLEQFKSVVYKWANDDIVASMKEVKEDFARPDAGPQVQANEKRIRDQLKAMIDNLAVKPPDPKQFAQRNGGGGPGGGGGKKPPSVPTDIELRLLKDLQLAVNDATRKVDEVVQKQGNQPNENDVKRLTGLGDRQNSLRDLLGRLIEQASQGQVKLPEQMKPEDLLPEEVKKDDQIAQDLIGDLLQKGEDVGEDDVAKSIKRIADRQSRSRQRVGDKKDPGEITQLVQKNIIKDLDDLIKLAQQQQQQGGGGGGSPSGGQGQQPGQAQGQKGGPQGKGPGELGAGEGEGQQGQSQGKGTQAAADSKSGGPPKGAEDTSRPDMVSKLKGWGVLTERDRQSITEGAGEKNSPKYDQTISDYQQDLARRLSDQPAPGAR